MPGILVDSPRIAALMTWLLPCVISALTALVAWQGFRRLGQDALRRAAFAFAGVAAIQAMLLLQTLAGWGAPRPLLRALDCASMAVMGWAFLGQKRGGFLVSALAACGVLSGFTLSLWQLNGEEIAWTARVWSLTSAVIYGAVAGALWRQRREQSLLLFAAFAVLALGSIVSAVTNRTEGELAARLIAFPLAMVALMQVSTRDLEGVQAELLSFSEHSLRQTQQLLTLLRTSTAFIGHSDVETILREAVEGVGLGIGADTAVAVLLDEAQGRALHVQAVYPPQSLPQAAAIPLSSQPAVASAAQSGLQVVWEEPQRGAHALAALMGTEAGPAIVQPMFCQARALGVLIAMNGRSQRAFSESEQRVMEAFGAQVAAAAENALLGRVLESQARELAELLRAREEEASRRAAILESIADGVVVFDEDERAIAANPAAHAILDLSQADVIGKPLREMIDGQVHQDDYAIIHSRIESGQPLPPGFKVIWGRQTVALSVAPVKLSSSDRHDTVMVMRDITHDAEVDRMKNEFVAVVSHELRSPFAELDASVQIIRRYGLDHLLPGQREQLQQLSEGLGRAQRMINNLVTFAAFLSKQGQLRLASVDVGQLANQIVRTIEPMARTRGLTMALQVAGPLPQVYGDRDRLLETIYHLVHNAIKFNRRSGSVTVTCRSEPDQVIVEVSDTGIGIAPDKLPEIWRDFTQLADPLRRGVEGLGLGLPLVRYVVKAHGGQVWARSAPGQGSVFGFSLPAAKSA